MEFSVISIKFNIPLFIRLKKSTFWRISFWFNNNERKAENRQQFVESEIYHSNIEMRKLFRLL